MSRAFTKEDAQQEDVVVVARPPLPDSEPNLVTPMGLEQLLAEERSLQAALEEAAAAGDERRVAAYETASDELAARLSSAVIHDPGANDKREVRFGDEVRLRPVEVEGTEAGRSQAGSSGGAGASLPGAFSLRIVGVDEADPEEGLISHLAPLARSLLGAEVGDRVEQGVGDKRRRLEVEAIE